MDTMHLKNEYRVCLYFVVPCYNDADVLPVSVPVFLKKLDALAGCGVISEESRLVLINDGSADDTWETIVSLREKERRIIGMNMAHNAGEQNALLAGLTYAAPRSDCAITMDSDLQDDINAVDEMLSQFIAGSEIVLGVRSRRPDDPFFERLSSGLFYRLMEIAGTGQVREHANYRLMSRKAIEQLLMHTETHCYLPCVVSNMGLKRSVVYHERFARAAGSSGYTVLKKLRLALDAVFTHSAMPLKFISASAILCGVGFAVSVICALIASAGNNGNERSLWLLSFLFLIGAALFVSLRIVAEYIHKTFSEARRPPRWQVDTILD